MGAFILRRLLYSVVTLLILSVTIFLIVRLTGDPVALMAEASARPEDLERIRHQWGLDRSWPAQYVTFMQNAFTGELGRSFNYRMPVSELYFQRLPNSLSLGLAATLISLLIGVPAGIVSAVKVNTWWDNVAKGVALLGLSIPVFTLAGVNLVVMVNAAVIIEVIFAWPGIGRLLYEGIFQRDFPLVQGVVIMAGFMIIGINLVVDVLYALIDPRIRLTR